MFLQVNINTPRIIFMYATCAFLLGCTHQEARPIPALVPNFDEGVLIANTQTVGTAHATNVSTTPSDCTQGLGLGVSAHSATEDARFLLDHDAESCPEAKILFDGRTKADRRAGSLGVNIEFNDAFAQNLTNPPIEDIAQNPPEINLSLHHSAFADADQIAGLPTPRTHLELQESADTLPPEVAAAADAQKKALNQQFKNTIKDWRENEDRDRLIRESEKILSGARSAKRLATLQEIRTQQERVLELTALLREAERKAQLQQQQRQHFENLAHKKATLLETEKATVGLENNKLRTQVEALQAQIADFERYNNNLKKRYETRQSNLQEQISSLSADLKESQSRATAARQAAVLQAATQIAEAERLAFAAQVAQRQQLEMEAQRLQREALRISSKAQKLPNKIPEKLGPEGLDRVYNALSKGQLRDKDIERLAHVVINGKANATSLGDAQFVVNAENLPLKEIFALIIANVEEISGPWRLSWQLHPKNKHIAEEKWSVAAESSVNDFIAYVARQVYAAHKVKLAFKMFGKNRMVIITEKDG